MKILHSSDWHIGRRLYGRNRYDEFERFFAWLNALIKDEGVECLLVAGDVFDGKNPGPRAQSLYYKFLASLAGGPCRHVVISAGNHDSPALLDAPRDLLECLNVRVSARPDGPEAELLELKGADGRAELVICAAPYLREADLRLDSSGGDLAARERQIVLGLREHFEQLTAAALELKGGADIPIAAMAHLFVQGGRCEDGDGARALYVGGEAKVPVDIFSPALDYVALGHLHAAQTPGGLPGRRYSGAPLAMNFGERKKSVTLVELSAGRAEIKTVETPAFKTLKRIKGDLASIRAAVMELTGTEAWLEIIHEGDEISPALENVLETPLPEGLEILRFKERAMNESVLAAEDDERSLAELSPAEVFERRLESAELAEKQRQTLRERYAEILYEIENAEDAE